MLLRAASNGNDLSHRTSRWPKGLLVVTILLVAAAPLASLSGRIPGLSEYDYLIFYRLFFFNDLSGSLAMLATLTAAVALRPIRNLVIRLVAIVSDHPVKTAVITFGALAACSLLVYQRFPLAMDEYAPLLQARIFASGELATVYPRSLLDHMVIPPFQGYFILVNPETGQAASAYWPGLALLMAPFAKIGLEWCVNPLLAASGLWLVGDLAKQATGHEQARGWAMLAALASPQFTVNAISYYAMPGLLTLSLLFIWLLIRPQAKSAMLAGVVGSVALAMHNPVPHALIAAPCIVWLLANTERRKRVLPLALGYVPLTLILCLGWPLITSSMGLRPLGVATESAGFLSSWAHKLYGLFVLPDVSMLRLRSYAAWKVFIWTAPGMVLVAFLVKPRTDLLRLLIAGFLLTYAFYFFIPFDQGHGWGYRYIHPAWGLFPIAAAVFATKGAPSAHAAVAASIAAGLLATPVFMYTTRTTVSSALAQQIEVPETDRALVFVAIQPGMYSADIVRNYPHDSGKIVRMLSAGIESDRALVESIAPNAKVAVSDHRGSSWTLPDGSSLPSE